MTTSSSSQSSLQRVLLIGASRGLGLAMAAEYLRLGWQVVATARAASGTPLHRLADTANGKLTVAVADMNEPADIAALHAQLAGQRFDLLFVNAGVINEKLETVAEISTEEFIRVFVTNSLSPMRAIEALQDLVLPTGTIGVMSSGQGSITNNENGQYEIYRSSKAALNMFMRSFAARQASNTNNTRTLLAMAPGWVRTDMGGPNARLTIEESIPNLVATMQAQAGKPGLQYLDYLGKTVPW